MNAPWKTGLSVVAVAGAGVWAAALVYTPPPLAVQAAVLLGILAVAFLAYLSGREEDTVAPVRIGIYSASLIVCAGGLWAGAVDPVAETGFWRYLSMVARLDSQRLVLVLVPPVGGLVSLLMWKGVIVHSLRGLRADGRRRAASKLYGDASLLGRRHLRTLAARRGILLGQCGSGRRAPLIGWALEGSAITVAPPRTGKGATIALNLLSPGDRGFDGSTVLVDPRGEIWCVVARRRRELGRRTVLLDPFGLVEKHAAGFPDAHLPQAASARYNPFDFIRDEEAHAVRDIDVLLDALLTPPAGNAHANSRHFYESARSLIGGYMAWVRFREHPAQRNLQHLHRLLSMGAADQKEFALHVLRSPRFCGGLTHMAIERQQRVGKEEGGSNFTTIANQLAFLAYPEMTTHTSSSTFDPHDLADGKTDLFVVAPEELLDHVKGWLRLWITIPNAISQRIDLRRDMLLLIDEMPRLGYLKPVMDGYNMSAGRGVHFWCFAQSFSALDSTWGKEHRKTLTHLAEVIQILGFPRTDTEVAEEISRAIGHATFQSRSESQSGSSSDSRLIAGGGQLQIGQSVQEVRERVVTPEEIMTLGPDRQYVITAAKDIPRDALSLHHSRYWERPDARRLGDPNPFVLRKRRAAAGGPARSPREEIATEGQPVAPEGAEVPKPAATAPHGAPVGTMDLEGEGASDERALVSH